MKVTIEDCLTLDEVTIEDCSTLDEVEDAYVELVVDFKKLSKRFTSLKNEHASCPSIYKNIFKEKMIFQKLLNSRVKIMN